MQHVNYQVGCTRPESMFALRPVHFHIVRMCLNGTGRVCGHLGLAFSVSIYAVSRYCIFVYKTLYIFIFILYLSSFILLYILTYV